MEHISRNLKESSALSFQKRFEQVKESILSHPRIQTFMKDHKEEITSEMLESSLAVLEEYLNQSPNCCKLGSANCKNMLKGYTPRLSILNGNINISYGKCDQKLLEEEQKKMAAMVTTMHMPKVVGNANLKDFEVEGNASRSKIQQYILQYITQYKQTGQFLDKGLYLFGEFGTGKTYILGVIADSLAKLKVPSLLVYTPELFRELRSSLIQGTFEERLKYIKNVPVLMLDDLGAEPVTVWIRDEVLGAILHYRMSNELPTFISSNYSLEELEEQISRTETGQEDILKAKRILERIKMLTQPIELQGENRRDRKNISS